VYFDRQINRDTAHLGAGADEQVFIDDLCTRWLQRWKTSYVIL